MERGDGERGELGNGLWGAGAVWTTRHLLVLDADGVAKPHELNRLQRAEGGQLRATASDGERRRATVSEGGGRRSKAMDGRDGRAADCTCSATISYERSSGCSIPLGLTQCTKCDALACHVATEG